MNATQSSNFRNDRGRGRRRSRGRGRGRFVPYNDYTHDKRPNNPQKRERNNNTQRGEPKKQYEKKCYRCGMEGHWSRNCRTVDHLVKLYQASLKGKNKGVETNANDLTPMDQHDVEATTSLDVVDFLVYLEDTK